MKLYMPRLNLKIIGNTDDGSVLETSRGRAAAL